MAIGADRPQPSVDGPEASVRRVFAKRRSWLDPERAAAAALVIGSATLGLGAVRWPDTVPIALIFPLVMVAGIVLRPRALWVVLGVTAVVAALWARNSELTVVRAIGVLLSLALIMGIAVVVSQSREIVGTRGFSGERMFADLRDRIASLGQVPTLPEGWVATSAILSAHGDRFSGDFIVVRLSPSRTRLEIALVDVSGKGTGVGTRSLLVAGALGALLGAVPSADFLRAANDHLLRQGWDEGFATAVHVDLDLVTGEYTIGNAGHPSPARFTSGRGRWTVLDTGRGPLLGVVPDAEFPRQSGALGPGDGLLLYSDGVVEARDRDLVDGIDRMLGVATLSVLHDGDVALDVCEAARAGEDDDRAALSVRRL